MSAAMTDTARSSASAARRPSGSRSANPAMTTVIVGSGVIGEDETLGISRRRAGPRRHSTLATWDSKRLGAGEAALAARDRDRAQLPRGGRARQVTASSSGQIVSRVSPSDARGAGRFGRTPRRAAWGTIRAERRSPERDASSCDRGHACVAPAPLRGPAPCRRNFGSRQSHWDEATGSAG